MSVQGLLNLITPRGGEVDPDSCLQCKILRKRLSAVVRKRDKAGVKAVQEAMIAHKNYGHPEDVRPISREIDIPDGAPRIV